MPVLLPLSYGAPRLIFPARFFLILKGTLPFPSAAPGTNVTRIRLPRGLLLTRSEGLPGRGLS